MKKAAEAHVGEDKKKRELVEARNQLDTLIYSIEKSLKDYGDKISSDEKKKIEEAAAKAKKDLTSEDASQIKKTQEELAKASHKLAEHVYKDAQAKAQQQQAQQQSTQGAQQQESKGKSKDDVVDAEYKVEDEDKEKKQS